MNWAFYPNASAAPVVQTAGYVFEAPAGAVLRAVLLASTNLTITAVRAFRVGGTGATINARNGATNLILPVDLSVTTASTWLSGVSLQNTAVTAGGFLQVEVTGVTGTPTYVTVEVDFQAAP